MSGPCTARSAVHEKSPDACRRLPDARAQVTNPPIDPLREGLVMSLAMRLGKRGNLLQPGPGAYTQLLLGSPVLLESELEAIRTGCALSSKVVPVCSHPASSWEAPVRPIGVGPAASTACLSCMPPCVPLLSSCMHAVVSARDTAHTHLASPGGVVLACSPVVGGTVSGAASCFRAWQKR